MSTFVYEKPIDLINMLTMHKSYFVLKAMQVDSCSSETEIWK
jgi:hypothetical protein